jgi:hypothetical protein
MDDALRLYLEVNEWDVELAQAEWNENVSVALVPIPPSPVVVAWERPADRGPSSSNTLV